MGDKPEPIARASFDAARLQAEHPPKLRHPNKRIVYEIACPPDRPLHGTVNYTRWLAMPLPRLLGEPLAVEPRQDIYDYRSAAVSPAAVEWHVNFADPRLFIAYGSGLFAQDEMQVAEHPVLACMVEALADASDHPLTVERGSPMPVLVAGVERRVAIAVDRSPAEGRPAGLYGNRFAAASADAIRHATRPLNPPTLTNLIAIAAPSGGSGAYRRDQIAHILATAFTGFYAAHIVSQELLSRPAQAVVHTGFWGCGAFGGHRVLMALCQIIAARLAGIRQLVFHAVDSAGAAALHQALRHEADWFIIPGRQIETEDVLDSLLGMSFRWGASDGN